MVTSSPYGHRGPEPSGAHRRGAPLISQLVVDASITLAWLLDDERNDLSESALTHVETHGAIVPTLWSYEVANVLALLVRRERIDTERAATIGAALDALAIVGIPPDATNWRSTTMALAAQYALTVYDASYLSLAITTNARLATLDRALAAAAMSRGLAFASD